MRVSRKALEGEVKQLRAQVAANNLPTRKALNEYVRAVKAENETLKGQLKAAMDKLAEKAAA